MQEYKLVLLGIAVNPVEHFLPFRSLLAAKKGMTASAEHYPEHDEYRIYANGKWLAVRYRVNGEWRNWINL